MEIKLKYTPEEICNIYSQALEWETGMPVNNLSQIMDFDSYKVKFDSYEIKCDGVKDIKGVYLITIKGVHIPFELDGEEITVINSGDGWKIAY